MKFRFIIRTFALCVALAGFTACGEDLEKTDYNRPAFTGKNLPSVTTGAVVENLGTQVTAALSATAPEGTLITEAGLIISDAATDFDLSAENNIVAKTVLDETGRGEVTVQNLQVGKTYSYRAYALTEGGIAYGEPQQFTCSVMERVEDLYIDFADPAAADAFTTVALLGSAGGEAPKFHDLSVVGLPVYGYVSTIFDTDVLFSSLSGRYVGNTDNVITYKADFSGKSGVAVEFELLHMAALFGAAQNSPFAVYMSDAPITTLDELEGATLIGQGAMTPEDDIDVYSFLVPRAFNKPCYVSLRIKADTSNYGLALIGMGVSSMYPVED